ncbi:MAG: hypothetical protein FWC51_02655 [Proteobacteria bacterium]|nr:hypothetical protein [Pseudomonadota bacterium]
MRKQNLPFAICYLLFGAQLCAPGAQAASIATPQGTTVAALSGDIAPHVSDYVSPFSYNTMAPFLSDTMAARLKPEDTARAPDKTATFARIAAAGTGITPTSAYAQNVGGGGAPVSPAFAAANAPAPRAVVARAAVISPQQQPTVFGPSTMSAPAVANAARAAAISNPGMLPAGIQGGLPPVAASQSDGRRVVARAAMMPVGGVNTGYVPAAQGGPPPIAPEGRRVVARSATFTTNARAPQTTDAAANTFIPNVTSAQCLADYTTCMDSYCQHDDTLYNRCYCSPKLAEIDGQFQPAINAALQQIIALKNGGSTITDAEMEQIWGQTFSGNATSGNSLADLNKTLANIDWSSMESTARGQNAFVTGDQYCVQHLVGCAYMAQNLKDVYRSQINRDCTAYQAYLERLKTAAESAVQQLGGTIPNR